MNSSSISSFNLTSARVARSHPLLQIKTQHKPSLSQHVFHPSSPVFLSCLFSKYTSLRATDSNIDATISLPEGAISVMNLEEFVEKDWSVLDSDDSPSKEEFIRNIDRIITAGRIEESSRVLVSIGSEEFVDHLVNISPCKFLLVVHDSLLILALLKEKYDNIKCWQGEIIHVPEKWAPLDVVFLYFLPALPFKLDQIMGKLAQRCSPGARLIISHPQGREELQNQRQQYPLVVVSELPDKTTLERVAAANSFHVAEFIDESGLYLAILNFSGAKN